MTPFIVPPYTGSARCKAQEPNETPGHRHACVGPYHGYDEHLCVCGVWFKVGKVESA